MRAPSSPTSYMSVDGTARASRASVSRAARTSATRPAFPGQAARGAPARPARRQVVGQDHQEIPVAVGPVVPARPGAENPELPGGEALPSQGQEVGQPRLLPEQLARALH